MLETLVQIVLPIQSTEILILLAITAISLTNNNNNNNLKTLLQLLIILQLLLLTRSLHKASLNLDENKIYHPYYNSKKI